MRTIVQYVYQTNTDLMLIMNHLKKLGKVIDKTVVENAVFDFCNFYHFFGVKLMSNFFKTTSTKSELFDTQNVMFSENIQTENDSENNNIHN